MQQHYLFFTKNNSNRIINNIATIPNYLANNLIISIIHIVSEVIVLLFIIIGVIIFNYKVFLLLVLILFPITTILSYHLRKKQRNRIPDKPFQSNSLWLNEANNRRHCRFKNA